MDVFTVLSRSTPKLERSGSAEGIEFDATLESTLSASMELTSYPMESGVNVVDHSLILPIEYAMTIVASNNPIRPGVTDFIGGALSNILPGGLAGVAGISAGLLSSSKASHSATVLATLITSMVNREMISISGGDVNLDHMMITSVTRVRNVENEDGLECDITLQEVPLIELIQSDGLGKVETDKDDPASSRAGNFVDNGVARVKEAGEAIRNRASAIFNRIPGADVFDSGAGAEGAEAWLRP